MKIENQSWPAEVSSNVRLETSGGVAYLEGTVRTPYGYVQCSAWPWRGHPQGKPDGQCVTLQACFNGREYTQWQHRSPSEAITSPVGMARVAHRWIRNLAITLIDTSEMP